MDWNLKRTSWNFTGFRRGEIPNIDTDSGSSSLGGQQSRENFSVDLKLGQVVDSGNGLMDNVKIPSIQKSELSPSGSMKRARSANNGIQKVSCIVDGCSADLSVCREYHRRHKVCEVHSKTPVVTICGHKKRFCQQCSRFHSLEEFDEGKRSCRKRLEGHNRRRRKPQPEPLSLAGSFISNYQGTRLFPFSNPQLYATTTAAGPIWAGAGKPYEDGKNSQWYLQDKQNPFSVSCSNNDMGGGKQLSLLHGTNLSLSNQTPKSSVYQPLVNAFVTSESGTGNYKMFCDGLTTQGVHSDCALSLLSSSSTQTSDFNLSYMMQSNPVSIAPHPLGSGLPCNNLERVNSILVPNTCDASIHCQGMFQTGTEALPDNEPPQTLPFYWE